MQCNYKIGDTVQVLDAGGCCSTYNAFVTTHGLSLDDYVMDAYPNKESLFVIEAIEPYEGSDKVHILLIRDINTRQLYVMHDRSSFVNSKRYVV